MEQLQFDNLSSNNVNTIKSAIAKYINNEEFIVHLICSTNQNKSISIKADSAIVARIKLNNKLRYIEIKRQHRQKFQDKKTSNSSQDFFRIEVNDINDVLHFIPELSDIFLIELAKTAGEPFGCCHRYLQCSDEKKCINPDILVSLSCAYKLNIDNGRIFYGKNRNVK